MSARTSKVTRRRRVVRGLALVAVLAALGAAWVWLRTPPLAAMQRISSSVRLRLWAFRAWASEWEAITGTGAPRQTCSVVSRLA